MFLPVVRFGGLDTDLLFRWDRIKGGALHLAWQEPGPLYLLAARGGR